MSATKRCAAVALLSLAGLAAVSQGGGAKTSLTLTFEVLKVEQAKGAVSKLRLSSKSARIEETFTIAKGAKFVFDDGEKTRDLTAKTVLTDETAKEWLQEGKKVRTSVITGKTSIDSIRFGPGVQKKAKDKKEEK